MARVDAPDLLPAEPIREAVMAGDVTQLHRSDRHAEEGDVFESKGTEIEVVEVTTERLGDLTDENARVEGSPDLDAYGRRIGQTHDLEWDDEETAVLHRFEPRG